MVSYSKQDRQISRERNETMSYRAPRVRICVAFLLVAASAGIVRAAGAAERFEGRFYRGEGDVEYLRLLDISRRMFSPDEEFQNVAMLYMPAWNGFVEGPTWDAWWIQNSYGTTYCALPFYDEPLATFLRNAQALWFDSMGDGKRKSAHDWIAPDGCLCDAARPGWCIAKQGDGRIDIHDWGMEFTAAGILMQAECLLIERDMEAIAKYLPLLGRCADFVDSRRDPENNLYLAGPAGNLLAPSYAGYARPDGSFEKAYLAGLSITMVGALERLVELETLAGNDARADVYRERLAATKAGLPALLTEERYFIKSLDPDGTKHGVYGAEKHGYFEAVVNHDAMCFRVVDDATCAKIYAKIASIKGLRPHDLIITNYPSLDDMYQPPDEWLWKFGTWVNGGHWSTCEARMIMGYYRVGAHDDARKALRKIMTYAERFRMDNPLVEFGNQVYQPSQPINLCYDTFGPPAAFIRGLFEYVYSADGLTLIPHIPRTITRLEQHFPIRFGTRRLYLATSGIGAVNGVTVNGEPIDTFNSKSVRLDYDALPDRAVVQITLGRGVPIAFEPEDPPSEVSAPDADSRDSPALAELLPTVVRVAKFHAALETAGLSDSYEAAHAKLAVDYFHACRRRAILLAEGKLRPLPAESRQAAEESYIRTTAKLCEGLRKVSAKYAESDDSKSFSRLRAIED